MNRNGFLKTLPTSTRCEVCTRVLHDVHWTVKPHFNEQWAGIGIARCEPCSYTLIAAAGSDDTSHQFAQQLRRRLLTSMGQIH